jgi:hypothetical protein
MFATASMNERCSIVNESFFQGNWVHPPVSMGLVMSVIVENDAMVKT